MYGPWMKGKEWDARGFILSHELTVFAVVDGTLFKMVGLKSDGTQEGKYTTGTFGKGPYTFDVIKQEWERGTSVNVGNYKVKDVSCSEGKISKISI